MATRQVEPIALPPDELQEQNAAELFEARGGVVEHPEDGGAFVEGESEEPELEPVGVLEPVGELGVVDGAGEL